jgi:hypothetical protein
VSLDPIGAGVCKEVHTVKNRGHQPFGRTSEKVPHFRAASIDLLVTLRDAADDITALPAKEAALPEWQAAIEALILVVDLGRPTMFARIGMTQALNHHYVREFNRSRKDRGGGGESSRGTNDRLDLRRPSKDVGDKDHLKVFVTEVAAEIWFKENDPEGVAFEYEVLE